MRIFCYCLFALGGLASLPGFLGWAHPAGDSFAVLRPACVVGFVGLAVLSMFARLRGVVLASLGMAAMLAASIAVAALPGTRNAAPQGEITLYQKNMLFVNRDWREVAADIRALGPDVITLQEVSGRNQPMLADLADLYPVQQFCPFAAVGGVAVLSRLPLHTAGSCPEVLGLALLRVEGPTGPLWLMSLHLHWPWPKGQAAQAARVKTVIAGLEGRRVMGGDFNMIPWSHRMRSLERALHGRRAGPARITFSLGRNDNLYPMPIDHVIGPSGGDLTRRPRLGSDHFGLFARLGL